MSGQEQYQEGIKQFNSLNYKEALRFFTNALLIEPQNTAYLFAKGRTNVKLEKYVEALIDFDYALINEPHHANIHSEKGVAFFHLNRLDESLASMNMAQKIEPDNPYRYSSRAYIRAKSGDLFGAIEDYKVAIRLDPQDAVALNNLGMLQEQIGYKKDARKHFRKADEIADKNGINKSLREIVEKARKDIKPVSEEDFKKLYQQKNSSTNGISKAKTSLSAEAHQVKNLKTEKVKPTFKSYWEIIISVFSSKENFNDFIKFIKNLGTKK